MERIYLEIESEIFFRVIADYSILNELSEVFMFRPPNFQFNPKFKNKMWDGYIRLFNPRRGILHTGFYYRLLEFAELRGYEVVLRTDSFLNDTKITPSEIKDFIKELKVPFEPRDYQISYLVNAINENKSISLSPTSSGKSFIQYVLAMFYYKTFGHRVLMIVPNISLVNQMYSDFISYGCDENLLYKIKGGVDKSNVQQPIVISTWQSLVKLDEEWFYPFHALFGDEVHLFAAKSLTSIIEKMHNAKYRHGFSGTIPEDSKIHEMVLEGLFGKTSKYISTKELIDSGYAASLKVKSIVLNYSPETRKAYSDLMKSVKDKKKKYAAEKEFIASNVKRNNFLRNLVFSLENQNNLILFDMIDKHGKILKDLFEHPDRNLHFIYGGTKDVIREDLRKIVDNDETRNHNILASYGVFAQGVSIKKIDNIIFASGYKSEVKVLQSIGRSLRKVHGSDVLELATLYDIADDISSKSFENYSIKHFRRRLELYAKENFPFKVYKIDLK